VRGVPARKKIYNQVRVMGDVEKLKKEDSRRVGEVQAVYFHMAHSDSIVEKKRPSLSTTPTSA